MALTLNDAQETDLFKLLGLPEAAPGITDVALVVDAIVDLHAQVQELDAEKPSTVAAAAARNGMVVLDKNTEAVLRRDATEGRKMAAAAARQKVELSVDAAIDKGKIPLSSRATWCTLIESDPAMEKTLAGIADYTAVALSEIGHSADNTDLAETPGWFY